MLGHGSFALVIRNQYGNVDGGKVNHRSVTEPPVYPFRAPIHCVYADAWINWPDGRLNRARFKSPLSHPRSRMSLNRSRRAAPLVIAQERANHDRVAGVAKRGLDEPTVIPEPVDIARILSGWEKPAPRRQGRG